MVTRRVPRQTPLLALALAGCAHQPAPLPRPAEIAAVAPPVRELQPQPLPPSSPLRQVMLLVHAQARARVGLPPLLWSETLAAAAQGWASALARAGAFRHAAQAGEGENLWMGTRGAFSYGDMAAAWVGERRRFSGRGYSPEAGHYSQIVWRGTQRLGCALASNPRDDVLVCRYDPPGNMAGEAAY